MTEAHTVHVDQTLWVRWVLMHTLFITADGALAWLLHTADVPVVVLVALGVSLLPHWLVLRPRFPDTRSTGIRHIFSAALVFAIFLNGISWLITWYLQPDFTAGSLAFTSLLFAILVWGANASITLDLGNHSQFRWQVVGTLGYVAGSVPVALLLVLLQEPPPPASVFTWMLCGLLFGLAYSFTTGALLGWAVRGAGSN